jgi:hypothetical protein
MLLLLALSALATLTRLFSSSFEPWPKHSRLDVLLSMHGTFKFAESDPQTGCDLSRRADVQIFFKPMTFQRPLYSLLRSVRVYVIVGSPPSFKPQPVQLMTTFMNQPHAAAP